MVLAIGGANAGWPTISLFSSLSPSPFSRNTGWPEPLAVVIAPFALPIVIKVAYLAGPVAHSVVGLISPQKTWMAGANTEPVTLADMEEIALRVRNQVGQATLDEW